MESPPIDLFAVGIAAVIYTLIYFLWYSPWLFGPVWLKHAPGKVAKKKVQLIWNFILGLVIAYFIAFFQAHLGVTTVSDGVFVGFCFWIGLVAPTLLSPAVWGRKDIVLFFIEGGAKLLSLLVMSGMIGA